MNQKEQGVYHKYHVSRVDGSDQPGGRHENAQYFVLDVSSDPFALNALRAYASACHREYPMLAQDIESTILRISQINEQFVPTYEELGKILVKYIDRLDDPVDSDPLTKIVKELLEDAAFDSYDPRRERPIPRYDLLKWKAEQYDVSFRPDPQPEQIEFPILFSYEMIFGYGSISGVLVSTQERLNKLYREHLYFGEALGKHSDVDGELEDSDVTILSTDLKVILAVCPEWANDATENYCISGTNLFDKVRD